MSGKGFQDEMGREVNDNSSDNNMSHDNNALSAGSAPLGAVPRMRKGHFRLDRFRGIHAVSNPGDHKRRGNRLLPHGIGW